MMPVVQNVVHCLEIEQKSIHRFFSMFITARNFLFFKKEANVQKTVLKPPIILKPKKEEHFCPTKLVEEPKILKTLKIIKFTNKNHCWGTGKPSTTFFPIKICKKRKLSNDWRIAPDLDIEAFFNLSVRHHEHVKCSNQPQQQIVTLFQRVWISWSI